VQLKRRYDLIPNLVETAQGYATHEREVFEHVTEARTRAIDANAVPDQAQAENQITRGLRQLLAVAENYPDLKASQNFLELQNELTDTEDKIQASRRFYNMTVRDLNTKIQQFPSSVIARFANAGEREFFELEDPAERAVPTVSFGTSPA
jgi:LemA protein